MLDIKFIRDNPKKVKEGVRKKQVRVDVDRLLELDGEKRKYIGESESLRAEQKKTGRDDIEKARQMKAGIKKLEGKLEEIDSEIKKTMAQIPNLPLEDVPEGKDESENVVLREWGKKPDFKFKPKDYMEIGESLDLIDVKRAAKTSGTRFGYIKKEAALLEFALVSLALEVLSKEDFSAVVPPVMIKSEMMKAMGYIDSEKDKEERYFLEKDGLYLVGTSEQSIGPMHYDEVLDDLPRRYVGFSTCFRREAGAYGKDTRGILRVHQFDKVEMFSFCEPEKSKKEHELLLSMEEKLMQLLKLPYRVVQLCTGDIARPSAATFDIETWLPSQGMYRETHSTSNCTDYQARRMNIRWRNPETKKLEFVHTLNGTAFAIGRMLIAIIENYQQEKGGVKVPEVLRDYVNFKEIK